MDASERYSSVMSVLKELHADEKPMITALNKIDLLDDATWLEKLKQDFPQAIPISAKLRKNFDILQNEIEKNFVGRMEHMEILIPHRRMDLVDLFYREGKVEEIKYQQSGIKIKLHLSKILSQKILHNKEIERIS